MGTTQGPKNELDSYHTSDACVTRGRGGRDAARSRFLSEFGRINRIKTIRTSPGKDLKEHHSCQAADSHRTDRCCLLPVAS